MTYHYWYVPTHGRHRPRWARRHSDSREASVRSRAWRGWVASADEAAVAVAAGAGVSFGTTVRRSPAGCATSWKRRRGAISASPRATPAGGRDPGARRTRRTRRSRRSRVRARPQAGAQGGEGARQGAASGVEHPQIARQGTRRRRRRRRWRRAGRAGRDAGADADRGARGERLANASKKRARDHPAAAPAPPTATTTAADDPRAARPTRKSRADAAIPTSNPAPRDPSSSPPSSA